MAHSYNKLFFDYMERGSRASARQILPLLASDLPIRSVLDVGCGRGSWLAEWIERGVNDVCGVDGEYVGQGLLTIPRHTFQAQNIAQSFDLHRQFDLVHCLEVGEHVPTSHSEALVDNLIRHGTIILFSAATPGQGGEFHVNEQPLSFWRTIFRSRGYLPFDYVRSAIALDKLVQPWYRYNMLLYVHQYRIASLPVAVAATQIPDDTPIPEMTPWVWRLRCELLKNFPTNTVSRLAVIKHYLFVALFGSDRRVGK
jgi:SAM-dependent methyltransferase